MQKYPILVHFTDEDKKSSSDCTVEDDINEIMMGLDELTFDSSKGCLICANSIKEGDTVYLNRKGEVYHQRCYYELSK